MVGRVMLMPLEIGMHGVAHLVNWIQAIP